ncbi:glycosyltransferase [Lactiplantibacillus plantarum]|uniref:glycosyltransferase n=1 Tax=Lactiplantibacillus plantarum TaxID=1590 RepID=UPI0022E5F46F|nr:glycosyltransferase [Lactiplantibacillus plantarum]
MIFVTVGTHEQPFNRLIKKIDELKGSGSFSDDVIIQTGFSEYRPINCHGEKFFSHEEMLDNVKKARIVITHGGPSSFIMPLQVKKVPIVVPRLKKFDEHVNDHQLKFSQEVAERKKNIIVVENIENLEGTINNYSKIVASLKKDLDTNNEAFNKSLENIVEKLFS